MQKIVAVDIGGTSSRFAWFEGLQLKRKIWLETGSVSSFAELLEKLRESDFEYDLSEADIVVLAVAGPIQNGVVVHPPNIEWTINFEKEDFGFRDYALINDFLAQAYACLTVVGQDARLIHAGTPSPGSAKAVIGAGTGLGKACLIPNICDGYLARPSEGGHAALAIEQEEEVGFLHFLLERSNYQYVCWEDVVSGQGLSAIHEFLTGSFLEPAAVAETFTEDSETLAWAARFYGRACRNYILETLALGGLYIAGGVAVKNPTLIEHEEFSRSLRYARAHTALLEKFPVFLVDNEDSGLWGAAYYGNLKLQTMG